MAEGDFESGNNLSSYVESVNMILADIHVMSMFCFVAQIYVGRFSTEYN